MPDATLASWVAVAAASAGLSAVLIFLLRPLLVRHLLAHPNERSSHATPTPQGAGLAVMVSFFVVVWAAGALGMVSGPPSLAAVIAGAAALMVLGVLDDSYTLAVSWRLLVQALVAFGVVFLLPQDVRLLPAILPLGVERSIMVIGVMGFVNAVNFLDGLDWMTVAQVVPMTLGVAILCDLGTVPQSVGLLAVVLLGATLGFAVFNKHPAKIFLGDAGSLPIGLVLAFMLIFVAEAHLVSALLLALYTLADSVLTFSRRLINGERAFSAHRSHFYQRATAQGLRVPQVTARVFWLGLWLMILAIAAAIARTYTMDFTALALGIAGTAFVLFNLARGR